MKRGLLAVSIIMVALFCMGMGGLGGHPEGSVPERKLMCAYRLKFRTVAEHPSI
ncbi:MAG: hypothetical protein GWN14_26235 [candidate division Zixibacteria bacterium]|nr:hypothetical protein [candidate division Zixibacteria bacterium]